MFLFRPVARGYRGTRPPLPPKVGGGCTGVRHTIHETKKKKILNEKKETKKERKKEKRGENWHKIIIFVTNIMWQRIVFL